MENEDKIVIGYDDIDHAFTNDQQPENDVPSEPKIVIGYDDVKLAIKKDAQRSILTPTEIIYPESKQIDNSARNTLRASFRMKSQTKAIVALTSAFAVFIAVVVGVFFLLFHSTSKPNGEGVSSFNGLYLYNEKKAKRPLVEELCDLAKETIVRVNVTGPQLVKNEKTGEAEVGIFSGLGTGTVIASDSQGRLLILTNFHVISNYYAGKYIADHEGADINPRECNIRVTTSSGNSVPKEDCELIAVHKSETAMKQGFIAILSGQFNGTDLALIRTPPIADIHPRFYISRRMNLSNGEHLVTIGHPGGREFSPSEGTNQGLRDGRTDPGLLKYDIHAEIIAYSIPTNPGNSGGPVFDSKGRIVAVHTLGMKDQQLLNMGYPADEVLDINKWEILVDDPELSNLFDNIPRQ